MFALDYDGTIADTNTIKSKWIRDEFGIEIAPYNCDRTWCVPIIGEDNYNRMSPFVYDREHSLQAKPIPGAPEALRTLSEHSPVYVVTARTGSNAPFAEEWLTEHGLMQYIERIIPGTGEPKITVAKSLGCSILIDDDIRHLTDMPGNGMKLLLIKPGFEGDVSLPLGVTLCTTWERLVEEAVKGI
ncbi:MAG: hypothetical protein JXB48_03485 [Candidatus Latescibacteria bacterium]|nr:hypothetical protein [Candidatus Latescibacterota bacterium]